MPFRKLSGPPGGHLAALFTVTVWGLTFIATKYLLVDFSPLELLFLRFAIGYVLLLALSPRLLRPQGARAELLFFSAAGTGVTLYFLCENAALLYTQASNVGIIVSVAPFFTALFAHFFLKDERLTPRFFLGFAVAMAGIALILFNGSYVLKLNPLGDILALLACVMWGGYSVIMRKIAALGLPNLLATRRVFIYGLLSMLPLFFVMGFSPDLTRLAAPSKLFSLLFLGVLASALCYVAWNWCMGVLGAVKTSNYIYLIPVVTVIFSHFILHERITLPALGGVLLALLGLLLSEKRPPRRTPSRE